MQHYAAFILSTNYELLSSFHTKNDGLLCFVQVQVLHTSGGIRTCVGTQNPSFGYPTSNEGNLNFVPARAGYNMGEVKKQGGQTWCPRAPSQPAGQPADV